MPVLVALGWQRAPDATAPRNLPAEGAGQLLLWSVTVPGMTNIEQPRQIFAVVLSEDGSVGIEPGPEFDDRHIEAAVLTAGAARRIVEAATHEHVA